MRRRNWLMVSVVFLATVGSAWPATFQVGGLVEGVAVPIGWIDLRFEIGPVTLQYASAVGHVQIAGKGATGSSLDDSETKLTTSLVQLGLYGNWWRPPHVVVYSGLKAGIVLTQNWYVVWGTGDPVITALAHALVVDAKAVLVGWDIDIPEVPNAVISAAIGMHFWQFLNASYIWPPQPWTDGAEVGMNGDLFGINSFVEIGARIRVGRAPGTVERER